MKLTTLLLSLFISAAYCTANAGHHESHSEKNIEAYIISPKEGETVSSPVKVIFGLKGMGVAPAGVDREHTGHHHLLIDTDIPATDQPIPADDNHKHFGKGQTETTLELAPGEHTLQLLIGNHSHMQHAEPVVSKRITIVVE
ncbi:MAG: DUF4399 domain-containing protein [Thiotrichales bacterium]|nr:DUF4399 domain-containing protein [Thiotrichales bacterium]